MRHQDIVKLSKQSNWTTIQYQIAKFLDISIALYSQNGEKIVGEKNKQNLCNLFCESSNTNENQFGCIKSLQLNLEKEQISYFKCKANLHLFAFSVIIDETRLFIMGGKIYHSLSEFYSFLKQASSLKIDESEIAFISKTISIESIGKLKEAAEFTRNMAYVLPSTYYQQLYKVRFTQVLSMLNVSSSLKEVDENDELFTTSLNSLVHLFNINSASLMLLDSNKKKYDTYLAIGHKRDIVSKVTLDRSNQYIETVRSTKAYVKCTFDHEVFGPGIHDSLERAILFPIFRKETLIGILVVFSATLTDEELNTISFLSLQLSIVLENRAIHQNLGIYIKNIRKFINTVKTLQNSIETDLPFDTILSKIAEFAEAEIGSLLISDETSDMLSVKATVGSEYGMIKLVKVTPGVGIAGKVFSSGRAVVVSNIEKDKNYSRKNRPRYKTKSFVSIPLIAQKKVIGIINLADKKDGRPFNSDDLQVIDSLTSYATLAIDRFSFQKKSEELKKISITDPLTELLNKTYFQERLTEEIERTRRTGRSASLIILDIDNFKSINDNYGHPVGDKVLLKMAQVIRGAIRNVDVPSRYGGEEFAIILPGTSKIHASEIAERVCNHIHDQDFNIDGSLIKLSASVGLATLPDDADNIEMLIKNADIALYIAKSTGKNRVVLYKSYHTYKHNHIEDRSDRQNDHS